MPVSRPRPCPYIVAPLKEAQLTVLTRLVSRVNGNIRVVAENNGVYKLLNSGSATHAFSTRRYSHTPVGWTIWSHLYMYGASLPYIHTGQSVISTVSAPYTITMASLRRIRGHLSLWYYTPLTTPLPG